MNDNIAIQDQFYIWLYQLIQRHPNVVVFLVGIWDLPYRKKWPGYSVVRSNFDIVTTQFSFAPVVGVEEYAMKISYGRHNSGNN